VTNPARFFDRGSPERTGRMSCQGRSDFIGSYAHAWERSRIVACRRAALRKMTFFIELFHRQRRRPAAVVL
jgi:hypothetical protein